VWKDLLSVVAGPAARAILMARVRDDGNLAFPQDPPLTHGSGPAPDRILLIGDIIVRGVGVASYDLSLSGYLARRLALETGRGVDVDIRGIEGLDMRLAADALRREDLLRFDAVVVMIGIREVMSLGSAVAWERAIRGLLEVISVSAPRTLPVLIVGVAPFAHSMGVPPFVVRWLERRVARQNAATERACRASGVAEYVEFTPELVGIRLGRDSSRVYDSWAAALTPIIANALVADAPARLAMAEPAIDEEVRQLALDDLGVVDSGPNARANRIVEIARTMFGADAASINFIDHDRQWSQAASGIAPIDVARANAICAVTIKTPGVFVVPDIDQAPEFRDAEWLKGTDHLRFYAGYPLEAPNGERVGALCVMNRLPRAFGPDDVSMLRDLALRAQRELWLAAS
jgi:hypothetical protein